MGCRHEPVSAESPVKSGQCARDGNIKKYMSERITEKGLCCVVQFSRGVCIFLGVLLCKFSRLGDVCQKLEENVEETIRNNSDVLSYAN